MAKAAFKVQTAGKVSGSALIHEIRETSKVFSRDHGIKVQIGGGAQGSRAGSTDGKTVVLPDVPLGVQYDPHEVSVMRGYVDHEASHKRHTDFKLLEACKGNKWFDLSELHPLFMPVANALEDMRVEELTTREYAGSKYNLRAVAEDVAQNFLDKYAGTDIGRQIAAVLPLAVTWAGREDMGYNSPVMRDCLASLPAGLPEVAKEIVEEAKTRGMNSTSDVLQLALDTIKKYGLDYTRSEAEIEERARERERQNSSRKQDSGAKGSGSGGEGSGGGLGEGEGSGEGSGSEGGGEGGRGEGSGSGEDGVGEDDIEGSEGGTGGDTRTVQVSEKEAGTGIGGESERDDATEGATDADGMASQVASMSESSGTAGMGGESDAGINGAGRGNGAGSNAGTKAMGRDKISNASILDSSIDQAMNGLADRKRTEIGSKDRGWGEPDANGRTVEHYIAPAMEFDAYVTRDMAKGKWGQEPKHESNIHCAKLYSMAMASARASGAYQRLKTTTAVATNRMRKNLEAALLSKKDRIWRGGYEDGLLNTKALSKAMTGSTAIYKKRSEAEDFDTAVLIAVDASGSMRGKRAVAQQCLIALAEVFDRIGIPFAVTTWNTDALGSNKSEKTDWVAARAAFYESMRAAGIYPTHTRVDPLTVYELKGFGDTLKAAENSLAGYEHLVGGGNTDADAVLASFQRLLMTRPEKRKVFIVLSDGATCDTVSHDDSSKFGRLNFVCRELEAQCELIGIGIMDQSVKKHYKNWVVTRSLEELAGACMKPISRMLLGGKISGTGKKPRKIA